MLKTGILNPALLELLARIRHTNQLVIADRGFPYWRELETVDLSLVDGIPTVLQVLEAVRANLDIEKIYMAEEFQAENSPETRQRFARAMDGIPVVFESHDRFKLRVPVSIGLVRTGDTVQYANLILVSGRVEAG